MEEAKFSFCFIRVALIDCLAFEDRLTTAQHVEQKLRTSSHYSMVLMCYRNYKDKICNTDILRMQYACCYRLPVIQSPQNISTLYYLWRAVYKPHLWCIESLGWVSGCQTQVSGPQTTTRCAEGYLYLSYIFSECKILKNQNKKVSQLLKKRWERENVFPNKEEWTLGEHEKGNDQKYSNSTENLSSLTSLTNAYFRCITQEFLFLFFLHWQERSCLNITTLGVLHATQILLLTSVTVGFGEDSHPPAVALNVHG